MPLQIGLNLICTVIIIGATISVIRSTRKVNKATGKVRNLIGDLTQRVERVENNQRGYGPAR